MPKKLAPLSPRLHAAVASAQDKKSFRIRILDLRDKNSFTDFLGICSGGSDRQNRAIADSIIDRFKAEGESPLSVEGFENGEWIALDFGDIVFHVMNEEIRRYYSLETIWSDVRHIEIPDEL